MTEAERLSHIANLRKFLAALLDNRPITLRCGNAEVILDESADEVYRAHFRNDVNDTLKVLEQQQ